MTSPRVASPTRWMFRAAWAHRRRYAVGLSALFFVDALELAVPTITALMVDALAPGFSPRDGLERWLAAWTGMDYALLALLIVAVVAVQGVLRYYWRVGFIFTSQYLARDLRGEYFQHLLRLPRAFYHRSQTGDLQSRLAADIEAVRMFLGLGLLVIIDAAFYFIFVPARLVSWNLPLTLCLLAGLPVLPVLTRRFSVAIHKRYMAVQTQLATIAAHGQENFAGVNVVRGFAREASECLRFNAHAAEYRRRSLRLWKVQAWLAPSLLLLVAIEEVVIIVVGGDAVLAGTLSPGQFVAFFLYLVMLTGPMEGIGWTLSMYQRARASFQRLGEVLDEAPGIEGGSHQPASITGAIRFQEVAVRYPGVEPPALERFSLDISAGATVAFVGPLGSGKSTLCKLLWRALDPDTGVVLLDGRDLRQYGLGALRGCLGYVPQETFLFSTTIAENIALGQSALTRAQIERYAALAALDEALSELPEGYDTMLGERGVNLSGGQKQRVALARALAMEPRVLILDDCLSAVDARTEARILGHLRDQRQGRTTLLVSQRITAVSDADLIIVFNQGRVIARGRHEDLLAQRGWYAATYRNQRFEEGFEDA